VTTSLAFRVLLSHFLPGLIALPGALALTALLLSLSGVQSCGSLTCCSDACRAALVEWLRHNAVFTSLAFLVVPLVFGILLDDWRHDFWPCREDETRWDPQGREMKWLAGLPKHLFRFMYDEYYYYVEFDGNSFLAVGFSGLFVLAEYLRTSASLYSTHWIVPALTLLIVPTLLCWFLWRSWNRALSGFFGDLKTVAAHCEKLMRERCRSAHPDTQGEGMWS
jgi:hypothetical protein